MPRLFLLIVLAAPIGHCLSGCASSTEAPQDQVEAAPNAEYTDPESRADLIELARRDREARTVFVQSMERAERLPGGGIRFDREGTRALKAVQAIDRESTEFLKTMVAESGWPKISVVGRDGAHAAWLLVQHADADPEFQARVLELMEPLIEQGEAIPADFALLTDRVLLARGEEQVYGTQFTDDEDGVMRPSPTRDWESVDERRASFGLVPIAEYAAELAEAYSQPAKAEPVKPN